MLFPAKGLNHRHDRQILRQLRRQVAFLFAQFAHRRLELILQIVIDPKEQRKGEQRNQAQLPVDIEHHRKHADNGQHLRHQREGRIGKGVAQGLSIVGHVKDQFAPFIFLVKGERQALEVEKEFPPQRVDQLVAGAGGHVIFQIGKAALQNGN